MWEYLWENLLKYKCYFWRVNTFDNYLLWFFDEMRANEKQDRFRVIMYQSKRSQLHFKLFKNTNKFLGIMNGLNMRH